MTRRKRPFLTERICTECGELQPRKAFRIRSGNPVSKCKKCERNRETASYFRRPEEERRQYRRDYEASEQGKAARARVISARIVDGREHLRHRRKFLRSKYGMSMNDYDAMLAKQGGRCAICRSEDPKGRWGKVFYIDHSHGEYRVRGLLCLPCNTGLGFFYDDKRRLFAATAYLSRPLPLIDRSKTYPVKGSRDEQLRSHYGITLDSFSELLRRQGGVCAICNGQPHPNSRGFHVDHIKGTKDIRGILCSACNVGLGYFKHNPTILASAIWYLHKSQRGAIAA